MQVSRRKALLATTAAVSASALWRPLSAWATPSTLTTPAYVEVATAQGRVRGGHSRGALAFKGIPYAGAVTGAARFKEAPPPQHWSGVRDALLLGPPSLQGPGTTYGENEPAGSENCLVLNVWTPAVNDGRRRPVMVYSHGGGYVSGSGGSRDEDGARLAAIYDVVVVTTNHRLGLLGYLYLGELGVEQYASSGNAGMLDIVAALRWVKTNIEAFGGDPENVMIWGESGGGFKVGTLLAMPAAQGLFNKACIESGAALRRVPKEAATEAARRVLQALDIVGYNHDEATFFFSGQPEIFHLDDAALRSRAQQALSADADRVLSTYKRSHPHASAAEIFIAVATALQFGNDSITLAERKAAQPAPVYAYRYDYPSNTPIAGTDWTMRACHSCEIAVMSYNYDMRSPRANGPDAAEVSRKMSSLWASFARSGTPSADGVPRWPRYDRKNRATMIIDAQCRVTEDPDRRIRQMWESLRL